MSPTQSTLRRLMDAHQYWDQAAAGCFGTALVRINVNACIQALRSTTFILQSHKKALPDLRFGTQEYGGTKMRGDPALRWLVDARNRIVKQGDLDLRSLLRVSVVFSYLEELGSNFNLSCPRNFQFWYSQALKTAPLPSELLDDSYIQGRSKVGGERQEQRARASGPSRILLPHLSDVLSWTFQEQPTERLLSNPYRTNFSEATF